MPRTKKEKPFVLTPKTYWDPKRPHVSVSQLNDYLRSPEYYYKKHVLKQIEKKVSAPMRVGSYVDALLTNPKEAKKFQVKVLARDDRDLFEAQKTMDEMHLLTDLEHLKATQLVDFIKGQPFWQFGLKEAIFQLPLESTVGIEGTDLVMPVCGLPDRMNWVEHDGVMRLHIQDLKISSFLKTSTPAKWFYNAKEMGYIRQFAMYRLLACATFEIPPENVVCSHIVGVWHDDGLMDAQLYTFPDFEIDKAHGEIMGAVRDILNKRFDRKSITWHDAIDLSTLAAVTRQGQYEAVVMDAAAEEDEEEV